MTGPGDPPLVAVPAVVEGGPDNGVERTDRMRGSELPAHQDAHAIMAHLRKTKETLAVSRQCRAEVVEHERTLSQINATLEQLSAVAAARPDLIAQLVALRNQLAGMRRAARHTAVALSVEQSRVVQAQAALALRHADHVRDEVALSRRARMRLLPVAPSDARGGLRLLPLDA